MASPLVESNVSLYEGILPQQPERNSIVAVKVPTTKVQTDNLMGLHVDNRRTGISAQCRAIMKDLSRSQTGVHNRSRLKALYVVNIHKDPSHRLGIISPPVPGRVAHDVHRTPV